MDSNAISNPSIDKEFLLDEISEYNLPEYDLELHKLNEEPVMAIKNIQDLRIQRGFTNIEELSFKVPLYRTKVDGEVVENERYHEIDGNKLILLNGKEYFYIHYAKESVNGEGKAVKEIQAYSREFELSQKVLRGYTGEGRRLYYLPTTEGTLRDENGLPLGFLNYVEEVSSWRVEKSSVPAELLKVERILNFSNTNLLKAIQDVQKTFNCMFQFNTLSRTITVHPIDAFEVDSGLYISDKNFLKSIEKSVKADEIKTRLYIWGSGDTSIQRYTHSGQPYIENFDYFKHGQFMSEELIEALDGLEVFEKSLDKQFTDMVKRFNSSSQNIIKQEGEVRTAEEELKIAEHLWDEAVTAPDPKDVFPDQPPEEGKTKEEEVAAAQEKVQQAKVKLDSKIVELERLQKVAMEIDRDLYLLNLSVQTASEFPQNYKESITELEKMLDKSSTTNEEKRLIQEELDSRNRLLYELDSFIREDVYSDSDYTEHQAEELYEKGKEVLNRVSQPNIQFNASVVDFLSVVEVQEAWRKLALGSKVRLVQRELGFDYEVRLVGYEHTPEKNDLTLRFSSTGAIDDSSLYLRDLIDDFNTVSSDVDFSKYKWDKGEKANSAINSFINSNLDLAKNALIGADGQKVLIDDRGYWGKKIDDEGIENPAQLRMINNLIAMTRDNWANIEIAISPEMGINANMVNGKIGNFATINANQILVESFEEWEDTDQGLLGALGQKFSGIASDVDGVKLYAGEKYTELGELIESNKSNLEIEKDRITGTVENIKGVEDRVSTVEQTARDFSINFEETVGAGKLKGTNYTFDGDNATFEGGGLVIKNKAGEQVLSGDTDGNLTLVGNIHLKAGSRIDWDSVNKPEIPPGYTKDDVVKDLDYIFQQSTYIDDKGIWTPEVYANKINTSHAKIKAAQIEELTVGGNVTMGSDAVLQWTNLPGEISTLGKLTTITNNSITTELINALDITARTVDVKKLSSITSELGEITGGSINIGSGRFQVDAKGNVTLAGNINMSQGNISWSSENSPVKVQYATTASGMWHDTPDPSRYYTRYSYDGGETWTDGIRNKAEDGERGPQGPEGPKGPRGTPGSDAQVPSYIKSTYIDNATIRSPKLEGNYVNAGTMTGGVIQTSGSGKRITLNENNENSIRIYDARGALAGALDYNEDGRGNVNVGNGQSFKEAEKRVFLRTATGHPLKIESSYADMSIEARGSDNTLYLGGNVSFSGAEVSGLKLKFA